MKSYNPPPSSSFPSSSSSAVAFSSSSRGTGNCQPVVDANLRLNQFAVDFPAKWKPRGGLLRFLNSFQAIFSLHWILNHLHLNPLKILKIP